MAVNIETVATKIFKVIKGSGHDVKMYDSATGNETVDPNTSRYFYVKMPNYMVHLDPDNSEIKLHQGAEKTDEKVKGIINNIKHIAKSYMLDFDHRIFGKELTPKNYAFKIDQNRNEKDMSELQTEGYTPLQGSTKTSEQKLEGVKVIVRHNKAVDENSRGARSRNIQGIFVETSEGERFKYPHIHLNGARAMARHVHAGGKPHDEVGEAIVNLSDQLAKLKEVTKFARRFSQVQEQAADVLPLVDNKVADIKKTIHKLTTATGYADFKENYKASETVEPTIEALEELKGKFTVTKFDEKIGEVLPLLQSIVDEAKAEQDNSSQAIAQRIMAKIKSGDNIDMHDANATQQEYDPEKVGAFTNKEGKIAYRLSDLAAKIKDDEMSVFLARLSDKYTQYATDPNIQMKIKREPEIYKIQPWEVETAKAIIQGVKMRNVTPQAKAEDVIPNPEAELEEAVAPFGTDESFVTEAMACNCDENCACGGNCGPDCNCHTGCKPMNEAHDDIGAKVRMMISKSQEPEEAIENLMKDFNSPEGDYIRREYEIMAGENGLHGDDDMETIIDLMVQDIGVAEGDIKDKEDYMAKKKAIQDIQMDPNTAKDEELKKEIMRRKAELDAEAKEKGMKENPMSPEDMERIKKNAPEEMGISKSELAGMAMDAQQDFEDYRSAVLDDIKDPTSVYAGKSREEIIAMLRKEADGIGYADVSDGDRHPSEPEWLKKIADEMEKSKTEASGYGGQAEPYMHTIRVDGDYDMDRGVSEKDCKDMEYDLAKGGIKASCEPNEMMQGGVNIHTMSPKSAVVDALDNAGYEINEQVDKDIQRIKDLAGL